MVSRCSCRHDDHELYFDEPEEDAEEDAEVDGEDPFKNLDSYSELED